MTHGYITADSSDDDNTNKQTGSSDLLHSDDARDLVFLIDRGV